MKSIIISAPSSSSGKTTVTLGLMKALKDRNYNIQGYKVGPDYIDPAFHREVLDISSKNLDLYLMGDEGVKVAYNRGSGDLGIIEGVMGLYDGMGIDTDFSTYALSRHLNNLPIILVIKPKGQSTTIAAEINGILSFKNPNIKGIIINCVSKSYYLLLKAIIEKHCNIKVYGYIPMDERLNLESRHLGLVQATEIQDIKGKVSLMAQLLVENVNIEAILEDFKEVNFDLIDNYHIKRKNKLKIAVALDEAFRFYYEENLELLKECGDIIYFSPLHDEELPQGIDFLYMGGGYPEVFNEKLSSNYSMLESIKRYLENGGYCYGECGALMYLTEFIDNKKMVGFFKGSCTMTNRLQNFGYATIDYKEKNLCINCHEFHKSVYKNEEKTIYEIKKVNFLGKEKTWTCGYKKKNTRANYAHIHFFGNMEFLKDLLPKD